MAMASKGRRQVGGQVKGVEKSIWYKKDHAGLFRAFPFQMRKKGRTQGWQKETGEFIYQQENLGAKRKVEEFTEWFYTKTIQDHLLLWPKL